MPTSPWEPLPLILYGYAIHPLIPSSRRDTRFSTRTRTSTVSDRSANDQFIYRDVVSLEVGGVCCCVSWCLRACLSANR
jgi:dedicator of cytokinesis protein 3